MKVADVMSTALDTVATTTSVKEVCRIIFGRGINGVPVCKDRKIIGFISEKDILSKFHPSIEEYIEDPIHEGDFEAMEEKVDHILALTAEKIMRKSVITVTPDTPLLKALSIMFVNEVGRLPVVDKKKHLIGMITKGDIFRVAVGDRLPFTDEEGYHDWQARHYDIITDWSKRLKNEIPDLVSVFKKNKVKNIIDIGYGTGEHDIALAKEGFNVLGIESSPLMHQEANDKLKNLPQDLQKRLRLEVGNYLKFLTKEKEKYGAAIFMGNAFSHLVPDGKKILSVVNDSLFPQGSVIIIQITNFEKIFKVKDRLYDIKFGKSESGIPSEHLFLRFYDPIRDGYLTLNTSIFDNDGKKWKFRTMNSTQIANLNKNSIKKLLEKKGFKKISFYGGMFSGRLFKDSFKPLESDLLNVVAVK